MDQKYFQGSLDKKHYFEGWYFKFVTPDELRILVWIPSISLTDEKKGYLQVLDSKYLATDTIEYPLSKIKFPNKAFIKIGENWFSDDTVCIDVKTARHRYCGVLKLYAPTLLHTSKYAPTIMGPFSYFKNMQCNHGIISLKSSVSGSLLIDGKKLDMNGGTCYMEKDYGTSFPKQYLWLESHHPKKHDDCSIFCSYAHIPLPIFSFYGLICVLRIKDRQEIFASWNGAKAHLKQENNTNIIQIHKRTMKLTMKWKQHKYHQLNAPNKGKMSNTIKESSMDTFQVTLKKEDKILFTDTFTCGTSEISNLLQS